MQSGRTPEHTLPHLQRNSKTCAFLTEEKEYLRSNFTRLDCLVQRVWRAVRSPLEDCMARPSNRSRQETRPDSTRSARAMRGVGYRSSCSSRVSVALRGGFTLVEFLVVISIVVLLTGILMPSLARAREAADRMRCASNLRQVGGALVDYLGDYNDKLPRLAAADGEARKYSEGMTLTKADGQEADGLGRLLRCANGGGYLADARLLYCPCHRGEHPFERYASQISGATFDSEAGTPAYGNYQFRSHLDPRNDSPILNPMHANRVLVVDGMRTQRDFNHVKGTNRLFGDGHVDWRADVDGKILNSLPIEQLFVEPPNVYKEVWRKLDEGDMIH